MRYSAVTYLIDTTKRFAEKTAVRDAAGQYTFGRLLGNAVDLARVLKPMDVRRQPVAVFLHKSKEMLAAFAGIGLSGGFYVPLDTTQPQSRIANILSVLQCKVIVTDNEHAAGIPAEWADRTINIDSVYTHADAWQQAEELLLESAPIDTDPVYTIFTSGSTGMPKGVVVNHRGVIDYIDWAIETFGIDSSAVIGNQAPLYFDNSTLDVYLCFATGATLCIVPEENFAFPARLIDYLNDNGVTFVFWVPFVLINVANFKILDKKLPTTLRDVFFAGEVMPARQLNYWMRHLPNCRYVNLYGPTEITVDCTYYVVDRAFDDNEPLPIGKPCRNTEILILADRRTLCAQGETGEICVRGSSLANGYYNNPEKTADAFIQNPLNSHYPELIYCTGDLGYFNERGEVMFVGRKDSQIKHKGYRIELGEIENAVLGSDLVEEGCVIYNHAKQRITLVYSAAEAVTPAALRSCLAEAIPAYMLPTALVREEVMVRNANGKIDRAYYNRKINEQ